MLESILTSPGLLGTAPILAVVPILLSAIIISCLYSAYAGRSSPLNKLPGPWYAPYTSLHLQYGFATGTIWKQVVKCHAQYGPIVRMGPRQVWISDKDSIKQVLLTTDLPKVAMYAEISRDRNSPGLFGEIRPEPHRRLKKFLSPAFTVSYVDGLTYLFEACMQNLLDKYETSKMQQQQLCPQEKLVEIKTDLMDDLHNIALDIMGECSFGKGFGQTNPDAEPEDGIEDKIWKEIPRSIFYNLMKKYQNVYIKRALRVFGVDLKFDWAPEMVTVGIPLLYFSAQKSSLTYRQAIEKIVHKRRQFPETARSDLIQHLIEEGQRPDNGVRMDVQDIVDQMSEILLAGSETTSGTVACLCLEIARNPKVRAKLLKTMPALHYSDPIVGGKEVRDNPRYEYLNACIKECLRLHPIASEMGRRTGQNWVKLMGHDLPPHTVVSASYRDLQRNPEIWPQPERFWPERWLKGDAMQGAPEPDMNAYYPFSAGKHSCIGTNFAWAELRVIGANLFSRFDIEELPGQTIDWGQFITMQFTTGHWNVTLKSRV